MGYLVALFLVLIAAGMFGPIVLIWAAAAFVGLFIIRLISS